MSNSGAHKVLMDVDTGVDDAMALAVAVISPEIDLVGITTVAGNVDLNQATANTLRVLDHLGANDVPVYRGMSRPLARSHFDAAHFHGSDGLGGAPFPGPSRNPEALTAVQFILDAARRHEGELNLVFVGPLTNLATALILEPDLPSMVNRTVIMGGAFEVPGNTTPMAEFNVAVDPEAARQVAESSLNATWVGLDVTHQVELKRGDWEQLNSAESQPATLVREVSRHRFENGDHPAVYLHDPLAVGAVIAPDVLSCRESAIWVDTSIRETAGTTRMVVDARATQHAIAVRVDVPAFRTIFGKMLGICM
jgi:purine nucleosidase